MLTWILLLLEYVKNLQLIVANLKIHQNLSLLKLCDSENCKTGVNFILVISYADFLSCNREFAGFSEE